MSGSGVRHCRDCGRLASHAGDACAFCGGPLVTAPTRPQRGADGRHPQILAAAVTFCLGLLLFRVLISMWRYQPVSIGRDPLLLLEFFAAGGTVLYLVLRGEEGDFRALFVVTLLMFLGEEILGCLGKVYGLVPLRELAVVAAFATVIFSSLGTIAAVYDGPVRQPFRKPMAMSTFAILILAAVRALEPAMGPRATQYLDVFGILILVVLMGFLASRLFRSPGDDASAPAPESHVPAKSLEPESREQSA